MQHRKAVCRVDLPAGRPPPGKTRVSAPERLLGGPRRTRRDQRLANCGWIEQDEWLDVRANHPLYNMIPCPEDRRPSAKSSGLHCGFEVGQIASELQGGVGRGLLPIACKLRQRVTGMTRYVWPVLIVIVLAQCVSVFDYRMVSLRMMSVWEKHTTSHTCVVPFSTFFFAFWPSQRHVTARKKKRVCRQIVTCS